MKPVCVLGPTASGKSSVAMEVARHRDDVELVSVDSMQVYRGMDIGTAKPTRVEQTEVAHHLIDIADPDEAFTAGEFQRAWRRVATEMQQRDKVPLLVGGTGLYLRAVVDNLEFPDQFPEIRQALENELEVGLAPERLHERLAKLDPLGASRMEPTNERRVVRALEVTIGSGRPFSSFGPGLEQYGDVPFRLIGIDLEPEFLDWRIAQRYREQMESGFLAEAEQLLVRPNGVGRTARQALGYRELFSHLEQGRPLDLALDDAIVRTRRFARRQRKWHRRDPRIEWHRPDRSGELDYSEVVNRVAALIDTPY